jgi:hypothetical protein
MTPLGGAILFKYFNVSAMVAALTEAQIFSAAS